MAEHEPAMPVHGIFGPKPPADSPAERSRHRIHKQIAALVNAMLPARATMWASAPVLQHVAVPPFAV